MRPLLVRCYQPTNLKQRWGYDKLLHCYLTAFDFFAAATPRLGGFILDDLALDDFVSALVLLRITCLEFFVSRMLICFVP